MTYPPLSNAIRLIEGDFIITNNPKVLEKTMDTVFGLSASKLKGIGIMNRIKSQGYRPEGLVVRQEYDKEQHLIKNQLAVLLWGNGITSPSKNLFSKAGVTTYVVDLLQNKESIETIQLVSENGACWK